MKNETNVLYPELQLTIKKIKQVEISTERKQILKPLIDYVQNKVDTNQISVLNFICTHNSRRSQFAQLWAQTFSNYFSVPSKCLSGGVEVTAFNHRAVQSAKRSGFKLDFTPGDNPEYLVYNSENSSPIKMFSKLFDDPVNEAENFAAIMTCSHADDNCPFIPGTEKRIPVRYDDPKLYDDTAEESKMYDERSFEIGSEMFYVFSKIELKK